MPYDNKVMEALGKFMLVFSKKRMEICRECGVGSTVVTTKRACQLWLEFSKKFENISNDYVENI
jgi:hypothetical protein